MAKYLGPWSGLKSPGFDSDDYLNGNDARDEDEREWTKAIERIESRMESIKEQYLHDETGAHSAEYLDEVVKELKASGYEPFPGRTAGKRNWSQGDVWNRFTELDHAMEQISALVYHKDGSYNTEAPGLIEGIIDNVMPDLEDQLCQQNPGYRKMKRGRK